MGAAITALLHKPGRARYHERACHFDVGNQSPMAFMKEKKTYTGHTYKHKGLPLPHSLYLFYNCFFPELGCFWSDFLGLCLGSDSLIAQSVR